MSFYFNFRFVFTLSSIYVSTFYYFSLFIIKIIIPYHLPLFLNIFYRHQNLSPITPPHLRLSIPTSYYPSPPLMSPHLLITGGKFQERMNFREHPCASNRMNPLQGVNKLTLFVTMVRVYFTVQRPTNELCNQNILPIGLTYR